MIWRHIHLLLLAAPFAIASSAGNAASLKTAPFKTAEALRTHCLLLSEKGENSAAIADCDRAVTLDPKNLESYFTRGKAYRNAKDFDRAIADFNRALAIRPASPGVLTLRGLSYYQKGDYDRAIADYTQAIKLWPNVRLPQSLLKQAKNAKAKRESGQK